MASDEFDYSETENSFSDPPAEVYAAEVDLGSEPQPAARNDLEAQLYRYVRARTELVAEKARLKFCMEAMMHDVERRIAGLDYVYRATCMETVRGMLKGKARSVKTPYGVAGFRASPERVIVVDESDLINNWEMQQVPATCVVEVLTRKPVLAELKAFYEQTGEIPPGCDIKPATDEFYTK